MSKKQFEDRIEELELQVECAAKGHVMTMSQMRAGERRFECIVCGVNYWRAIDDLTYKEQALRDATEMPGLDKAE